MKKTITKTMKQTNVEKKAAGTKWILASLALCAVSISGLAWKIPGRVGDSAIIGAGQYTDNEIGAAGSA